LQHEVNALLVEPENPQALADGIRRMSNPDLAERIRRKAEEDVLQYTWEKRAQRIIAFLRELKRKE
jgi:glycosyltransferase involved in cell wall biosynthesis